MNKTIDTPDRIQFLEEVDDRARKRFYLLGKCFIGLAALSLAASLLARPLCLPLLVSAVAVWLWTLHAYLALGTASDTLMRSLSRRIEEIRHQR